MPTEKPCTDSQQIVKKIGKCYWAPFLHFYQPPTQDVHVLKEINETCYEPLFSMLLDNPDFKCTFNINTVLLDLLTDHGLFHTIDLLKKLVAKKQIEIVGSGKFHPILPLIPKQEVLHQIEMQESDLQRTFPGWSKGKRLKELLWLPDRYFFLGTQFHPEFKSRPWAPSPPYYGFVKAAYDKKLGKPKPEL